VDFAGWWMPVQYASIVDEHLATRQAIGLFDVSHMGRLTVEGPASLAWLESLHTRRVADLAVGQARYTLVTSDEGPDGLAILDDALVTREADAPDGTPRLAMVVNASNRDRVVSWLRSRLPAVGVSLADRTAETAMIAVQGPLAVSTVCVLCGDDDAGRISGLGTYRATRAVVAGQPAAVSRTGYTGEDGVEVVVAADAAEAVWQAIHDAGRPRGLKPCGLGARDTLRLEAALPLHGHELGPTITSLEARLGWVVGWDKPTFRGREVLDQQRRDGVPRLLTAFATESRQPLREGAEIFIDGVQRGTLTSGNFSPVLGHGIGLGFVDGGVEVGTSVSMAMRGREVPAVVVKPPFVRKAK
jgi:aminomethyltransferase